MDALLAAGTAHALTQGWSGADLVRRARHVGGGIDELQAMYLTLDTAGQDSAVRGEFYETWSSARRDLHTMRAKATVYAIGLLRIGRIPARRRVGTSRPNTDMLAKVRALLAKAEGTSFPAEAEAFTAKAQELMSRYAIDEAMIAASADLGRADPSMSVGRVHLDEPYVQQKADLLHLIAQANGARAVLHGKLGIATVVGAAHDIEMVELLFTSLLLQATVAMQEAGRQHAADRTRGFRASFLESFAIRVGERLAEAKRVATQDGERTYGSALVPVLAGRERRVVAAVEEMFPNLTSAGGSRSFDGRGWEAGRRAADRADVGGRRIAS